MFKHEIIHSIESTDKEDVEILRWESVVDDDGKITFMVWKAGYAQPRSIMSIGEYGNVFIFKQTIKDMGLTIVE